MSLFIAIRLPELVQEKIDSTFQDKDISEDLWQRGEDMHITLLFIQKGIPEPTHLESIQQRLKNFYFTPFTLKVLGPNLWTKKNNYLILHLQVLLSNKLIALHSNLVTLLPEVRKSTHEFTPHISLIRSTEISQSKVEEIKEKYATFTSDEFTIDKIHLYIGEKKSEDNIGNRYRIID